jgi:hypothetical protein
MKFTVTERATLTAMAGMFAKFEKKAEKLYKRQEKEAFLLRRKENHQETLTLQYIRKLFVIKREKSYCPFNRTMIAKAQKGVFTESYQNTHVEQVYTRELKMKDSLTDKPFKFIEYCCVLNKKGEIDINGSDFVLFEINDKFKSR